MVDGRTDHGKSASRVRSDNGGDAVFQLPPTKSGHIYRQIDGERDDVDDAVGGSGLAGCLPAHLVWYLAPGAPLGGVPRAALGEPTAPSHTRRESNGVWGVC